MWAGVAHGADTLDASRFGLQELEAAVTVTWNRHYVVKNQWWYLEKEEAEMFLGKEERQLR